MERQEGAAKPESAPPRGQRGEKNPRFYFFITYFALKNNEFDLVSPSIRAQLWSFGLHLSVPDSAGLITRNVLERGSETRQGTFWVRTSHKRERPVPLTAARPRRTGRCGPSPNTTAPGRFPGCPTPCARRADPAVTIFLLSVPRPPCRDIVSARPGPAAPSAAGHQGTPRDAAGHHGTRSPRRAAVRTPPARLNYKSLSASRAHRVRLFRIT